MFKNIFRNKKAVIFDLDGTLVETEEIWREAFSEILLTITYSVDYDSLPVGTSVWDKWHAVLDNMEEKPAFTAQELEEHTYNKFLDRLSKVELDITEGFWGLGAELKVEKEMKLALVTNTKESIAKKVMEKIGFGETFDVAVFGDKVKRPKPYPDIYKKTLKELGLKSSQVVVFEDSVVGAQSSVAAGLDTLIIWDAETPKNNYPSQVIEFFANFTPLVRNLDRTPKDHWNEFAEYVEKQLAETDLTKEESN